MHAPSPAIYDATFPQAKAPVAMIMLKGKPWWIARQVGKALGYKNDGAWFPRAILGRWTKSGQLKPGIHHVLFDGENLAMLKTTIRKAQMKAVLPCSNEPLGCTALPSALFEDRSPSLLLLSEPGLYASILLSDSPVGIALMDWLTVDVLPMIRRTGVYLPSDHPARHLVDSLGEAGFYHDTPEDDLILAAMTGIMKSGVNKGLSTVYRSIAQFLERRLALMEKRGCVSYRTPKTNETLFIERN